MLLELTRCQQLWQKGKGNSTTLLYAILEAAKQAL